VGALTVAVYSDDGLTPPDSPYFDVLRDVGRRAREADLVVAVDGGRVLGTVTFALSGTRYAEFAAAGEAEFRMLAVDPAARGRGVGGRLVAECLRRARNAGAHTLVLATHPARAAAHRLYERLGFTRTPDRDWAQEPDGARLLTYASHTHITPLAHHGVTGAVGDQQAQRTR
jgi:ribosomal protein S18 acetylase RimI-like enzyme